MGNTKTFPSQSERTMHNKAQNPPDPEGHERVGFFFFKSISFEAHLLIRGSLPMFLVSFAVLSGASVNK